MKRIITVFLGVLLLLTMSACSESRYDTTVPSSEAGSGDTSSKEVTAESHENTEPSSMAVTEQSEQSKEEEPMKQTQFYITVAETTFTVNFADEVAADSFRDLLGKGDLTINMSDYGGFEKVGSIGQSLARKDTQISTTTGDVMLYQGNQVVIFYGNNSWSYSRLGKIEDATAEKLLSAFGSGDVTVTFSLTKK